jgi:oligopeptide transport system substrate-binding protein
MKEAGYEVVAEGDGYRANGFPQLEMLYNNNETQQQAAVATQDMWRRNLGISVKLHSEDWKVLLNEYHDGHFQVIRLGWSADYDHPHTFLDLFHTGNTQNSTGWSDGRYDALLERAAAEPDPARSIALYREAEAIAVQAMPRIPLYFDTRLTLVKPWVKGLWGSALRPHRVEYLWIDPAWERGGPNEPAFLPPEFPPPGRLSR